MCDCCHRDDADPSWIYRGLILCMVCLKRWGIRFVDSHGANLQADAEPLK